MCCFLLHGRLKLNIIKKQEGTKKNNNQGIKEHNSQFKKWKEKLWLRAEEEEINGFNQITEYSKESIKLMMWLKQTITIEEIQ